MGPPGLDWAAALALHIVEGKELPFDYALHSSLALSLSPLPGTRTAALTAEAEAEAGGEEK